MNKYPNLSEQDWIRAVESYRKQIEIAHDIMDTEQQVMFFATLKDWEMQQKFFKKEEE